MYLGSVGLFYAHVRFVQESASRRRAYVRRSEFRDMFAHTVEVQKMHAFQGAQHLTSMDGKTYFRTRWWNYFGRPLDQEVWEMNGSIGLGLSLGIYFPPDAKYYKFSALIKDVHTNVQGLDTLIHNTRAKSLCQINP
uniref:Uncharacterized protein n=1 Tax=Mucochytrium quahogii TaxID=96639 RepID=A0A7S2R7V3_9STRA|mmetsp:Transcript_22722/g.36209  ORF Transcript_22722/g.36209 Transcript_22722/m.36209 type:complete len:137 (+) Transcript_22722:296-706(+)